MGCAHRFFLVGNAHPTCGLLEAFHNRLGSFTLAVFCSEYAPEMASALSNLDGVKVIVHRNKPVQKAKTKERTKSPIAANSKAKFSRLQHDIEKQN